MTFDEDNNYNFQEAPWFSPQVIIRAINNLSRIYGKYFEVKGEFKRAREMFDAAVALVGAYVLHSSNKFFMQPNFQSGAPDVMAVMLTEKENSPVVLEISPMEMVSMNEHSKTDNVVEFLKKTKLSFRKAYGNKTIIVCMINREIQLDSYKIVEEIRKENPEYTIYILGKIKGNEDIWTIFSPWPKQTKLVSFSLLGMLNSYQIPDSISLHRGVNRKVIFTEPKKISISVYELFHIDENKVEKYKSINTHVSM